MPRLGGARPARPLGALLLAAVVLAGCASSPRGRVGAPSPRSPRGPSIVASQELPPLVSRVTPSDAPPSKVEAAVGGLVGRIGQALTKNGDETPAVRISRKQAAGNQVIVRWTLGTRWPDPGARTRVRVDALTVLRLVRASRVAYGSVLLLATGISMVKGKRKVSIVVRAKYTRGLVRATDWSRVAPVKVFGMCDDKPAVIAAGYK